MFYLTVGIFGFEGAIASWMIRDWTLATISLMFEASSLFCLWRESKLPPPPCPLCSQEGRWTREEPCIYPNQMESARCPASFGGLVQCSFPAGHPGGHKFEA